jgi:hypothetical protein
MSVRVYFYQQTLSVEQMCYKYRSRSGIQWHVMPSARAAPEPLPIRVVIV